MVVDKCDGIPFPGYPSSIKLIGSLKIYLSKFYPDLVQIPGRLWIKFGQYCKYRLLLSKFLWIKGVVDLVHWTVIYNEGLNWYLIFFQCLFCFRRNDVVFSNNIPESVLKLATEKPADPIEQLADIDLVIGRLVYNDEIPNQYNCLQPLTQMDRFKFHYFRPLINEAINRTSAGTTWVARCIAFIRKSWFWWDYIEDWSTFYVLSWLIPEEFQSSSSSSIVGHSLYTRYLYFPPHQNKLDPR